MASSPTRRRGEPPSPELDHVDSRRGKSARSPRIAPALDPQPRREPEPAAVPLRPWQENIVRDLREILRAGPVAANFSEMGTGKTFMTAAIAAGAGLALFVVAPLSTVAVWQDVVETFALPCEALLTYRSLASVEGKQPKHGYLSRADRAAGPAFAPTAKFAAALRRPLLLVFDESQRLKNASAQREAAAALSAAVADAFAAGGRSRLLLLSATPFEEEANARSYLRLAGFFRAPDLLEGRGAAVRATGLAEVVERCMALDARRTFEIVNSSPVSRATVDRIAFRLWVEVAQPTIARAIANRIGVPKDAANGFYVVESERDRALLSRAISALAALVKFRPRSPAPAGRAPPTGAMGAITSQLVVIERLMAPVFARLADRDLATIPGCKVIVCVNFSGVEFNTLDILAEMLARWEPLVLRGSMPAAARAAAVAAFQAPGGRRLLLMTTKLGLGISLHDRRGDEPRRMYISPSYSLQDVEQATGRIYRDGTRSPAHVRLVYSKTETSLVEILEALARKSKTLREVVASARGADAADIVYPGEYPREVEDDAGRMVPAREDA